MLELSADHTLRSTALGEAETNPGTFHDGCMEKSGLLAWNIQMGQLDKIRNLQIHVLKPLHLRIAFLGRCVLP